MEFEFKQSNQKPYDLALELLNHNISCIPVHVSWTEKEGTTKKEKRVVTSTWRPYQTELMSEGELNKRCTTGIRDRTFDTNEPNAIPNGVALTLSDEHGNLGDLDFDYEHDRLFPLFIGSLFQRCPLIRPKLHIEKTPSEGYHVIFKLPETIPTPAKGEVYAGRPTTGNESVVLVETRGCKQVLIISPTIGYRTATDNLPLTDLEPLTEEEYTIILEIVRSFDERPKAPPKPEPKKEQKVTKSVGRPRKGRIVVPGHLQKYCLGEYFLEEDDPESLGSIGMANRLFPVDEYLLDHGWLYKGEDASTGGQYIRPGKTESDQRCATLKEVHGINYFHNFSSSADPVEADKTYTPFELFCTYEGYDEDEGRLMLEAMGYVGYRKGSKQVMLEGLDLEKDEHGGYLSSINNAVELLTNAEDFRQVAKYNDLNNCVELVRELDYLEPGAPLDKQTRDVMRVLISQKYGITFSDMAMQTACNFVYPRQSYNPFLEFVQEVVWDGKDRITTLLCDCFGVEYSPYIGAISDRFLIAAIARQYQPGLKFDYTLALISSEGTGKSGLVARLFDPCYLGVRGWNADAMSLKQLCDPKLFVEGTQGKVGVEIAEFAGSKRVEIEELKSALTCRQRTFRGAYKEQGKSIPVRQVFVVTTNETQFLTALTGNRRFWVVYLPSGAFNGRVYSYLTEATVRQIWAQALVMYKERCDSDGKFHPESLLLPPELEKVATAMQEKARHHDPLEDDLLGQISLVDHYEVIEKTDDYITVKPKYKVANAISTKQLWEETYPNGDKKISSADSKKLASILTHYNWTSTNNVRIGGARQRGYVRPESDLLPIQIKREQFVPREWGTIAWNNPLYDYNAIQSGIRISPRNLPEGYAVAPCYQDQQ